jgi:hypothetical protein
MIYEIRPNGPTIDPLSNFDESLLPFFPGWTSVGALDTWLAVTKPESVPAVPDESIYAWGVVPDSPYIGIVNPLGIAIPGLIIQADLMVFCKNANPNPGQMFTNLSCNMYLPADVGVGISSIPSDWDWIVFTMDLSTSPILVSDFLGAYIAPSAGDYSELQIADFYLRLTTSSSPPPPPSPAWRTNVRHKGLRR